MNILDQESIIGVTALLVHAAKIDEKYSENEKKLIREFIKSYLKDDNIEEILKKAEELEEKYDSGLQTRVIGPNLVKFTYYLLKILFIQFF